MAIASIRSIVSLVFTNRFTIYANRSTVYANRLTILATASKRSTNLYELVDRFSSTKDGWLLHPSNRQTGQQTDRPFHVERKWMVTASKRLTGLYQSIEPDRPVYIDRLNPVNRFIDRKDYKFSFLPPLRILLLFHLSVENPRNLIYFRRYLHLGCKTSIFGLSSSYSMRLGFHFAFFSPNGRFYSIFGKFSPFLLALSHSFSIWVSLVGIFPTMLLF